MRFKRFVAVVAVCFAIGAAFVLGFRAGYNEYLADLGDWQQADWPKMERMCRAGELYEARIDCPDVFALARIHRAYPAIFR